MLLQPESAELTADLFWSQLGASFKKKEGFVPSSLPGCALQPQSHSRILYLTNKTSLDYQTGELIQVMSSCESLTLI